MKTKRHAKILEIIRTSVIETQEDLSNELNKAGFEIENLYETSAGCVIGTHCGPRTIGILYIKEK